MDWQQTVSLFIVATTAGLFLWTHLRPKRFNFQRDTHCGCHLPNAATAQSSIVIRARKGEPPQVAMKMK